MAYITIPGDSDGDLHDAAMHNSKFGAIASVLNGNIDLENLANPNNFGTFHFHGTGISSGAELYEIPSATSGSFSALTGNNASGSYNSLKSSYIKTDFAFNIQSVRLLGASGPTLGGDWTIYFQVGSTLGGAFTTYSSKTFTFNSASLTALEQEFTTVFTGVAANSYLRVVVYNGTGGAAFPPPFTLLVTYKTEHTS